MSTKLRRHIRANLLGYVAIFIALTIAPAWAATLKPNSVGTKQLRKNAVTSPKIRNGQVKRADLANGAVNSAKLADGQVTNPKLANGAVNSAKVQDNSLTGSDIDESTLSGIPVSGAAGGDLAGLYPDPTIANGAVDTAQLADDAVNTQKLAEHAVIGDKVAHDTLTGTNIDESTLSGVAPGGAAGGALSGNYPNPTLSVSGGPCANGQALTNVSSTAALTCAPGVYSDGNINVAAGPPALPALTTGNSNSALGWGALERNTDGNLNSAFGTVALYNNTSSGANTVVGAQALSQFNPGGGNTVMGANAMFFGDGNENTALGTGSMFDTGGDWNVALGEDAGSNLGDGNRNIDIANYGGTGESNTIRIGDPGFQNRAFIAGIRGTTTGVADAVPVLIDSAGQLGTASSSRRYKRDIRSLGAASEAIMRLRPVSFRYKQGPPELHYGLIAEQVARVFPQLAVFDAKGRPDTVQYQDLPVLLLNEVQRQRRTIARQQAQIDWLLRQARGR